MSSVGHRTINCGSQSVKKQGYEDDMAGTTIFKQYFNTPSSKRYGPLHTEMAMSIKKRFSWQY